MGGMYDRSCRQKKQAFEKCVVERVEECTKQADRGKEREVKRNENDIQPDTDKDDADIFNT